MEESAFQELGVDRPKISADRTVFDRSLRHLSSMWGRVQVEIAAESIRMGRRWLTASDAYPNPPGPQPKDTFLYRAAFLCNAGAGEVALEIQGRPAQAPSASSCTYRPSTSVLSVTGRGGAVLSGALLAQDGFTMRYNHRLREALRVTAAYVTAAKELQAFYRRDGLAVINGLKNVASWRAGTEAPPRSVSRQIDLVSSLGCASTPLLAPSEELLEFLTARTFEVDQFHAPEGGGTRAHWIGEMALRGLNKVQIAEVLGKKGAHDESRTPEYWKDVDDRGVHSVEVALGRAMQKFQPERITRATQEPVSFAEQRVLLVSAYVPNDWTEISFDFLPLSFGSSPT